MTETSDTPTPRCPCCGGDPGKASSSLAPGQRVCTGDCPVVSWDSTTPTVGVDRGFDRGFNYQPPLWTSIALVILFAMVGIASFGLLSPIGSAIGGLLGGTLGALIEIDRWYRD